MNDRFVKNEEKYRRRQSRIREKSVCLMHGKTLQNTNRSRMKFILVGIVLKLSPNHDLTTDYIIKNEYYV
jgi:hypothetical protein